MTNSFVTNAVLIERALSCWHLYCSSSRRLYIWIVGCQIYSKVPVEVVHVSRAPVS